MKLKMLALIIIFAGLAFTPECNYSCMGCMRGEMLVKLIVLMFGLVILVLSFLLEDKKKRKVRK